MGAVARRLDLNFKTVRRYLRAGSVDTLLAGGVRASVLDSFKPYLHEQLANGVRNATVLQCEIVEQGCTGGYTTLARYLRPLLRVDAAARDPGSLPRVGRRRPARGRLRPDDQGPVRRRGYAHQMVGAVDADLPPLRSFAAGLRRDLDAVLAGLTLHYNSGAVEGTVNRIKQLKMAMYGRATPDLLRKRIVLA